VFAVELAHREADRSTPSMQRAFTTHMRGSRRGRENGAIAAVAAGVVLRRPGVELIEDEVVLAGKDSKVSLRHAVPQRALAAAQRAGAVDDVVELRLNVERDLAAMTRARWVVDVMCSPYL
jgi:hypothetical protein